MDKIEIYKNDEEIRRKSQRAPEVLGAIQAIYDKLNGNGLTTSFEKVIEITTKFIFATREGNARKEQIAEDLLKSIAVDSLPANNAFGFAIKREKMLEMVEVKPQDIQDLLALFDLINIHEWSLLEHIEFDAQTKKVKYATGHLSKIEEKHTIYADNAKQVKITKAILALREAINAYCLVCEDCGKSVDRPEIAGLITLAKDYRLDHMFVKESIEFK